MKRNNISILNISILMTIFFILLFVSCDVHKEYVNITVINKTNETLDIESGFFISYTITAKTEQSFSIEKGQNVSARGKETNNNYGSKVFQVNGEQWIIE